MKITKQLPNNDQSYAAIQVAQALRSQPALANWFQQFLRHSQMLEQDVAWLTEISAGIEVTIKQGIAAGMKWKMFPEYPLYFPRGVTDLFFQLVMQQVLNKGDSFFDVGANAGFHTLAAAACVGESGSVTAFEPLAKNVDVLNAQINLNGLTNCKSVAAAIGNKDGKMRFYEQADNALGTTIPAKQSSKSIATTIVEVMKLDSIIGDNKPPTLVKIDVEGAEADVLAGAKNMLADEQAPILIIELHDAKVAKKVFKILNTVGYSIYTIASNQIIHTAHLSPTNIRHIVAARNNDTRLPMILPRGRLFDLVSSETPIALATLQDSKV